MHSRIIQDNFRYHYRLHLPDDPPVPVAIEAKPFWDPVLTETFVRHLRVPVNYWEQVLSRFPASPHDPNRTSERRISQLLIQGRLTLYPVRHLDQHQGQAAITPPVVPGENGIAYQLAPASVLLVGATPPKTKSFDSKDAAAAFITGLNLNESQLRGLAQSSNLPVSRGQQASSLMTSLSQALLDGRLVVIIRQSSVTPPVSADSASTSSASSASKPVSLGPHAEGGVSNIATDPIAQRRVDNERLKQSPQYEEDKKKVGVTKDDITQMSAQEKPLGFEGKDQFIQFKAELDETMNKAGLSDAEVRLKGTSTTFYSENPSKPLGHHWDADFANPGDYDLNITSDTMAENLQNARVKPSEKYGVYKTRDIESTFPELNKFQEKWSGKLGREVNFVGYPNPVAKDATEYVLRSGAG